MDFVSLKNPIDRFKKTLDRMCRSRVNTEELLCLELQAQTETHGPLIIQSTADLHEV